MTAFKLNSIEEAIKEIANGNIVIAVDDEDRENEGDFITSAELITPEKVNFMITHGRGVLLTIPLYLEHLLPLPLIYLKDVPPAFLPMIGLQQSGHWQTPKQNPKILDVRDI
jgi:3,4-dihydroxy-2-butanone 4-phosphate synthase